MQKSKCKEPERIFTDEARTKILDEIFEKWMKLTLKQQRSILDLIEYLNELHEKK